MNERDKKVLELQALLESKQLEIDKITRFRLITNGLLSLYNQQYNLNVCDEVQLKLLLATMNSLKISSNDLNMTDLIVSNYKVSDWINDIQGKLENLLLQKKKKELADIRKVLDSLLSEETKVNKQLDEIERMLK